MLDDLSAGMDSALGLSALTLTRGFRRSRGNFLAHIVEYHSSWPTAEEFIRSQRHWLFDLLFADAWAGKLTDLTMPLHWCVTVASSSAMTCFRSGLRKPAPLEQAAVLSQPTGSGSTTVRHLLGLMASPEGDVWHNIWFMGDERVGRISFTVGMVAPNASCGSKLMARNNASRQQNHIRPWAEQRKTPFRRWSTNDNYLQDQSPRRARPSPP